MSTGIEKYFSALGDPQTRAATVRNTVGKMFLGAVKSPTGGTGTRPSPLLSFADNRGKSANTIALQAGYSEPDAAQPAYVDSIISTESGGNFRASNAAKGAGGHIGHFGRSQFGVARLQDAKNAGVIPANMTPGEFMASEEAQLATERWHYADLEAQLGDLVGTEVNGKPMTIGALVAMGHLGGAGGARQFVESGGAYNPADVNGTSLADYAIAHGGATGDFLASNSGLSYGEDARPVTDEDLGRNAGNYSMGMGAQQFETLKEKYGERAAMEMLNNSDQLTAPDTAYPDAIMRYLDQPNAAQKQADSLAATLPYGGMTGGDGGYSMGIPASEVAVSTAGAGGGAPSSPPAGGAPPVEEVKIKTIDKIFNSIYGTSPEDMTEDERTDRRRAIGQALTEGFQMLSRGTPMDIEPIIAQKMDLQQTRRAAEELKSNAQGVSDMLVASGMSELAQLPFAGESGMNAAMNALASRATAGGGDAPFEIGEGVRATMAQTASDMGMGGVAEQFMTMPSGDGLKELYSTFLGQAVKPAGSEGGAKYSPEARAGIKRSLLAAGDTMGAELVDYASDTALDDIVTQRSGVAPAVAKAGGEAAATASVDQEVEALSAEALARGYEEAGMAEEASIAAAAGSGEEAKQAVADFRVEKKAVQDAAAIKARGEAVAALVPDTLKNAAELKATAKAAQTSQDLDQVYAQIAGDPKTTEEQLYRLAEKDPAFLPFLTDMMRAKAGTTAPVPIATQMNLNEITAVGAAYTASITSRAATKLNAAMMRQIVSNPDFQPGKIQGSVVVPLQQWADSILGDSAPDIASDATMTGARLVDAVRANVFVAASQGLKGAISDKETAFFVATSAAMTDTKLQMLSLTQYQDRIADIQEAEYNAMLEWTEQAQKDGKLGDRTDMIKYVNEKVGDRKVFEQYNEDDLDTWLASEPEMGEVIQIIRKDGSVYYEAYIP